MQMRFTRRRILEVAMSIVVALGLVIGARAAMGGVAPLGLLASGASASVQAGGRSVSVASLQRRVQLLEAALEPRAPREAAERWAEGVRTRNGALQYALLTPELREKALDYYEGLGWVTGTSSPWATNAEVAAERKLPGDAWEYEIEYEWATSTGPAGASTDTLTVVRQGESWLVKQVRGYSEVTD